MKQNIFCTLGLCLFLLGSVQSQSHYDEDENGENPDQETVVTQFERDIWSVTANLYKVVKETEAGNFILSPLSLSSLMVMLNAGAGGETGREIQNHFKFGPSSVQTIRNHTELLTSLKRQTAERGSGVEFVTASRIYANTQNSRFRSNYTMAVRPLGEVETLDFTDPKPVVMKINEWVKTQTRGKIGNIVEDKDFEKDTAAVLLNALYFKAQWKHEFNKSDTKTKDFHVSENKTVKVEMMYISAEFPYVELSQIEASAVFLPYKGDRISMIIYLPWAGKNLSTLEEKLETLVPSQIRNQAATSKQSLYLPKFKISSSLDFKEILTSLGLHKMFERDEADFSKMTEAEKFYVSKVRQNVFVEVNEEGTEAAAVTDAFAVAATSFSSPIEVNRPFIFQIYDSVTGTVLLNGRIVNPNEGAIVKHTGQAEPQKTGPQKVDTQKTENNLKNGASTKSIFITPLFTIWVVWSLQKVLLC